MAFVLDDGEQEPDAQASRWYLEGYVDERRTLRRIPVAPLPFRVGRRVDLELALNFANISRVHADLYEVARELMVRDLDSRNGTFVNRERITGATSLHVGDVLHFGNAEFRVGYDETFARMEDFGDTCEFKGVLPAQFVTGTREFMNMLRTRAVTAVFQPLLRLEDRSIFGYEALGRGQGNGISEQPVDLFRIASGCGLEEELSRVFRGTAVEQAVHLPNKRLVFLNVHPGEMRDLQVLVESVETVRTQHPEMRFAMEVHESLVTDLHSMREFQAALRDLRVDLAYDDFGAGQARLVELAEAPPDFLKFDRSMIAGIHAAGRQRQQMVEMLVRYCSDVGVTTLAEGIEVSEEADACRQLGFHCGQGYYLGRPLPVDEVATA